MTKKALLFGLAVLATGSSVMAASDGDKKLSASIKDCSIRAGKSALTPDTLLRFAQILSFDSTNEDVIKLVNFLSASSKGINIVCEVAKLKKEDRVVEDNGNQVGTDTTYSVPRPSLAGDVKGTFSKVTEQLNSLVDVASIYNDTLMVKNAHQLAANNKRRPVETPLELQPGMLEAKVGVVGKTALFIEGIAALLLEASSNECKADSNAKGFLLVCANLIKGLQRYQIWAKQSKRLKEVREQLEQQGVVSNS